MQKYSRTKYVQVFKAFANIWSLMTDFMLAEDQLSIFYSEFTVANLKQLHFQLIDVIEFILFKVLLETRRMEFCCQFCFDCFKRILRFSRKWDFVANV